MVVAGGAELTLLFFTTFQNWCSSLIQIGFLNGGGMEASVEETMYEIKCKTIYIYIYIHTYI